VSHLIDYPGRASPRRHAHNPRSPNDPSRTHEDQNVRGRVVSEEVFWGAIAYVEETTTTLFFYCRRQTHVQGGEALRPVPTRDGRGQSAGVAQCHQGTAGLEIVRQDGKFERALDGIPRDLLGVTTGVLSWMIAA